MTAAAPAPLPLALSLDTVLARVLDRLAEAHAEGAEPRPCPPLAEALAAVLDDAGPVEARLAAPAVALGLGPGEVLGLHLLWRVETDPTIARQVAQLQAGDARHRPSVALLADVAAVVTPPLPRRGAGGVGALLAGPLFALPLARVLAGPAAPLALGAAVLTEPLLAVLGLPAAVSLDPGPVPGPVPPAWCAAAAALVGRLPARPIALVLRGGLPGDQRLYAEALAHALGRPLAAVDGAAAPGLGPALAIAGALPVEAPAAAPGARVRLAALGSHGGPRLVLMGEEGGIEAPGWQAVDVRLPPLPEADRAACWAQAEGPGEAGALPVEGLGPARLAAVAARLSVIPPGADPGAAFRAAAGEEARPDLEPHARLVAAVVDDAALVAPPPLRADLDLLLARCRQRRDTRAALGPAFHARGAETGVRALLAGPSGGGKTLACAWLATRLARPLFRVDLASVVSKYIGETEENLARLLDRAEAADVILLFDEADSLFGARTEVKHSSDRFANNQTNFLLTRIEGYGGIVLLTTNGRQRIDPAFSRRIDQIIDVTVPDAPARRALWRVHLGEGHGLSGAELNRLAGAADVAGGHIRSAVLTAAVLAAEAGRPIGMDEAVRGLALEYRKIGRAMPAELVAR